MNMLSVPSNALLSKSGGDTADTGLSRQTSKAAESLCFHCLEPVDRFASLSVELDGESKPMCCIGCQAAAEFIISHGLQRFYQHRSDLPADKFFADVANSSGKIEEGSAQTKWRFVDDVDTQGRYVTTDAKGLKSIRVEVNGLYCASCSWLIERALRSTGSDTLVRVDVESKVVTIETPSSEPKFAAMLAIISGLGYNPRVCDIDELSSSARSHHRSEWLAAVKRIVVAGFGTMQVMTYAVASYVGVVSMEASYARFLALVSMLVATVVVFYSGKPFFIHAMNDLRHRRLGMDVPVAAAIGAAYFPSVYTVLAGSNAHIYFDSAVMFVFFLSLGRFVEMRARHRLLADSDDVEGLLPRYITVQRDSGAQFDRLTLSPKDVQVGDQLQLRARDVVPFDAVITGGIGELDESMLSGESRPVVHSVGDTLCAGSIVTSGTLLVEANQVWGNSTVCKIQRLLQRAKGVEWREVQTIERIGRYFIALVLGLTVIVGALWATYQPDRVFEVCLAMLVASCPCAFSLATPVARSTAINTLKRIGVLMTNATALDAILSISHWCFDKTGTLTDGKVRIQRIVSKRNADQSEMLNLAASLEKHSDHTLASAFQGVSATHHVNEFEEIVGLGVTGLINGTRYWLGKREWVLGQSEVSETSFSAEFKGQLSPHPHSEIVLATHKQVMAIYSLQDAIRPSAFQLVKTLIRKNAALTVLSGDREVAVDNVAKELKIEQFLSGISAEQKLAYVLDQQARGKRIAMLGDGVNDAPVIAAADLSVAIASGSDLSINNADIILLHGNLARLIDTHRVAKFTAAVIRQNLAWALAYNVLVLPLAALGLITPWMAALGMSASSLLVVLNAARIRRALPAHN